MKREVSVIGLLLVVTFVKGLVMSIVVPFWEFPDEQAHFAQVLFYNETGMTIPWENNLSQEILEAEKVMGTNRNNFGVNKITYHPEYRHEFSESTDGPKEAYLNQLPKSTRINYLGREVATYPPLFYLLSSIGYRLVYAQPLIMRVFFTRIISVVLGVATVWAAYMLGMEVFKRRQLWAVGLAALVSFQPMFSFLYSGVNNDNLMNLVAMMLLYLSAKVLSRGLRKLDAMLIGVFLGLGILTKPLIVPLALGVFVVLAVEWIIRKRSIGAEIKLWLPLIVLGLIGGGWTFFVEWHQRGMLPYIPRVLSQSTLTNMTFREYIVPQLGKYYRETLVWYWGVFKWLGVVLPRNILRAIKLVMGLSAVGLVRFAITKKTQESKLLLGSLGLVAVLFFAAITVWDFSMVRNSGITHGLQGRYFFSTLGVHMIFLLVGWVYVFPEGFRRWAVKLAVTLMVGLNLESVWVIVSNYYSTESVLTLLLQMSQYKPWFLKYPISLVWFGVYGVLLAIFVASLWRLTPSKRKRG